MKPTFNTIRAIGAEFARRSLKPFTTLGVAVCTLLLALGGWLTTLNVWWWLLEALFIFGALVFAVLNIVVRVALRVADPPQSKEQKQAVSGFVDKLQRVSENLQTPYPVILFRIIRDTVWPRKENFIETVSRDSKTLAPEFTELLKLFRAG